MINRWWDRCLAQIKISWGVDNVEDDCRWWMDIGIDVQHKLNTITLMSFIMMIKSKTLNLVTLKIIVEDDKGA